MIPQQALELASNLVRLTKEFKSTDPQQAADIKSAFREKSKNDLLRTVVYLLEVVGSRDFEFKAIQQENVDLKELLKVHNIDLEKIANGDDTTTSGGDTGVSTMGSGENTTESGVSVQNNTEA